ncbi:vomeronasal type-2 receptor 26-like [Pelobates fuscus]|uniref:vomeronasal type-2 receptor 26-like n=1 Tax=Pelobates fuscus TaxID=191477 RepID=UPI002FE47929
MTCDLIMTPWLEDFQYFQDGDIVIGGVLSVNVYLSHNFIMPYIADRMLCAKPVALKYKNLLTFLLAIEEINYDPHILPNITLGYHVYDSCSNEMKAVKSVLQILSGPGKPVPNYSCTEGGKLAGVIGDQNSITTIPIAQILGLYGYSQLISSWDRHNHISEIMSERVISSSRDSSPSLPPDIAETILISYGATSLILSDRNVYPTFFRTLQNNQANYHVLSKLLKYFGWTWVGIFASDDDMGEEETQVLKNNLITDGICVPFTIKVKSSSHLSIDKRQYDTIKNSGTQVIVITGSLSLATIRISDIPNVHYDGHTPHMNRAVQAMIKALHNMHLSLNIHSNENNAQIYKYKYQLHHYLRQLDVMDKTGLHRLFNNKGETVSGYRIMNWKSFTNGSTRIEKVGSFDPWAPSDQQLSMETNLITWKNDQIPISRCSETCQPGSRKVLISQIHSCCYKCVQCAEGEISNISDSKSCLKCPDTEWPNKKRDKCIPKQIEFLSISGDWIAMVLVALSVLFCLITAAIFIIFTSYRDTAIVKANNQNLSYILLVSIMMSFLCVFMFFGHPSDVICMLRQTCVGVIYSIAMSSILAKTIIVCIAFKASKPGSIWKKWFGPKLQNSVVLLCSSFQVIICLIWLGISPPYQEANMHSYQEKIIIQCNEGLVTAFYFVLGYMGILAAMSFILAFMVRTLPDSFNEAKYITFSMLVFCSVWIAMIPAYLSTKGKSIVAVQIFAILTSSAGLLGFIFFPKCYIILWKTELNTRTHLIEKRKSIYK